MPLSFRLKRLSFCVVSQSKAGRLAFSAVFAILGSRVSPCWSAEDKLSRPFTIQEAIEISYIIDGTEETNIVERGSYPPGIPITAPDKQHFLVVSQRGVLAANTLEATLWLFDYQSVLDYVSKKSQQKPIPKKIATLSACSNTPVISAVRWLGNSDRIAFLGKSDSPNQQLFVADLSTGSVRRVTDGHGYVTAYDIRGETTVYTILSEKTERTESEVVNVTGKTIYSLLFPKRPSRVEDFNEGWTETVPSVLHIMRNDNELPISFTLDGKPLALFKPVLSLSPDGKRAITVAPLAQIPSQWPEYIPSFEAGFRYVTGDRFATADENPWKASRYVLIDLEHGTASTLVDAPAGRGLGFFAPTRAIWASDGRRVILSNTFLPGDLADDPAERAHRVQNSAVAMVDVVRGEIQPIAYFSQPALTSKAFHFIRDVSWNEEMQQVTLDYASLAADKSQAPAAETYGLQSGQWGKIPSERHLSGGSNRNLELSIEEDLNNPPALAGNISGSSQTSIIWNPNPQLERVALGKASVHSWKDTRGNSWSGILVLPPDYDSQLRYPLVLQTHPHDPNKFFADGAYSTGSAGRALASKGVVVLQIGMIDIDMSTEGSAELAGMESAIDSLVAQRVVDRQRVGIIGFSRTCFHVLYAMTHRPHLFAAASITDGLNFGYFQYILLADQFNYQDLFEHMNGGSPFGEGLENWARNAPGFELHKVETPLLISALEKGELMTEWETYSGLHRLRKPVDMLWLREENAPHILVQPRQRYLSQQAAVDWFVFWLKGEESPDSDKQQQYLRWRQLRSMHDRNQKAESSNN
jgi:hypothetical protein